MGTTSPSSRETVSSRRNGDRSPSPRQLVTSTSSKCIHLFVRSPVPNSLHPALVLPCPASGRSQSFAPRVLASLALILSFAYSSLAQAQAPVLSALLNPRHPAPLPHPTGPTILTSMGYVGASNASTHSLSHALASLLCARPGLRSKSSKYLMVRPHGNGPSV
ncbi:hypothetical protein CALCODRAFT_146111 [Calocera cornea HHB12733]|uniref:Uncharacterized protein n=1 Tax=Calocera cornea HHB12733 TaxID=1353952 RepID=A0A165CRI2_9BASI|nr:hypothetical protein CALCODRAFT_146111 [Calocera cornea HHB12733]